MPSPRLTFSTGSLHHLPLERAFGFAAEAGCDGMEVICDLRAETRDPDGLRRLGERFGLPILSLHTPFERYVAFDWRRDPREVIKETVALAEAIGAEHVVLHVPKRLWVYKVPLGPFTLRIPWPWRPGVTVKAWIAAGGLADLERGGVRVCLENMPHPVRWLADERLHWFNSLETWPRAHRHLALDTAHWATHGIDPVDAWRAGGERIRHIHLSNFVNPYQHQLPHRGDVDLDVFLATVVADGFDGLIVLELNPNSLEAPDEAAIRRNLGDSVAFCRRAMSAAGP